MKTSKTPSFLLIGLTGGIATGKSSVATILKKSKIPVICADETVHTLMKRGGKAYQKIVKAFGREILLPDGEINRSLLGERVFFEEKLLRKLESLVHPLVREEMAQKTKQLALKNHRLIVWDVPLLFESGIDKFCDKTVCVTASQKTQIERIKKRDKLDRKHALARIRSQMPLKQKEKMADDVIRNNGTRSDLAKQVKNLIESLKIR